MLIIVRGLPGSGKSTIARRLLAEDYERFVHLENDMFLTKATGEYIWSPSAYKAASAKCFEITKLRLATGFHVIVSNCFLTNKAIKKYADLVNIDNLYIIDVKSRFESIHNMSDKVMKRMQSSFEDLSDLYKTRKTNTETLLALAI